MTTSAENEASAAIGTLRAAVEGRPAILSRRRSWRQRLRLPLMLLGPIVVLLAADLLVSDDRTLHLDRRRLCRRGEGFDQQRGFGPRRRNRRSRQRAGQGRPGAVHPRSAAVPHRRRGGQGAARLDQAPDRGDEGDLSAEEGRRRRYRGHPDLSAARIGAAAAPARLGHRLAVAVRPVEPRLQDRPRTAGLEGAGRRQHPRQPRRRSRHPGRSASDGAACPGGARSRRAEPFLHGGARPRSRHRHQGRPAPGRRLGTGREHRLRSDRAVLAGVDQAPLGDRQFQGDRAHPYAARADRDGRDRHLSRCRVPGQGAELEPGHGADLLAAAGGERDRQLGQGGPASAGAAEFRQARPEPPARRRAQRHRRGRYRVPPALARPHQPACSHGSVGRPPQTAER